MQSNFLMNSNSVTLFLKRMFGNAEFIYQRMTIWEETVLMELSCPTCLIQFPLTYLASFKFISSFVNMTTSCQYDWHVFTLPFKEDCAFHLVLERYVTNHWFLYFQMEVAIFRSSSLRTRLQLITALIKPEVHPIQDIDKKT